MQIEGDQREGTGVITWILAVLASVLLALAHCGCDDGDSTVNSNNEAPEYVAGTNGHPVIFVEDTTGGSIVVVDVVTGEATPYDVFVKDTASNSIVSIKVGPTPVVVPEVTEE